MNHITEKHLGRSAKDLAIIFSLSAAVFWVTWRFSLFHAPLHWIVAHEETALDEVFVALIFLLGGFVWFGFRRWTEANQSDALRAEIVERQRAEGKLKLFRNLIDRINDGIEVFEVGTLRLLDVNQKACDDLGYTREELLGLTIYDIDPTVRPEISKERLRRVREEGQAIYEAEHRRKDGSVFAVEVNIKLIELEHPYLVAVVRDITERVRLEENLRQSQKMESVGRLAGGVAHDFNNILTAINGYIGFALAGLAEGDQRRSDLNEVLIASARATRLTGQLLAFSRKQILKPQILDLNAAMGGIVNMIKRLIGEDIKLESRLAAQPCSAMLDAGQIEQVYLNLAVNARDAMPNGGTLIFETTIATTTEDFSLKHPDMPRVPLVCLSACDTGCGMSEEVKAHLFEPFFTTKEKGKGTGLGLSSVYGIIKQSGGAIEVESAPGRGTTFRIYFPRIDAQAQNQDKDKDAVPRGNGTVLLVEDEESIRRLGAR